MPSAPSPFEKTCSGVFLDFSPGERSHLVKVLQGVRGPELRESIFLFEAKVNCPVRAQTHNVKLIQLCSLPTNLFAVCFDQKIVSFTAQTDVTICTPAPRRLSVAKLHLWRQRYKGERVVLVPAFRHQH